MAVVTIRVVADWLDAPGVTTPELAATWARYEVWVGDECVSQVESTDRTTLRRSLYGSLYPLAEWVAANWWFLTSRIRPSALESRYWTWDLLRKYPWLRSHNMRGAGDGMSWPNLTIVPQGSVSLLHWAADGAGSFGRARFVMSGDAWVSAEAVRSSLAAIVNQVLERLAEQGITKTTLADDWNAVATVDDDERAFCEAVARLGLDPYDIDEPTTDAVIEAAQILPGPLRDDFFDTVDPVALHEAAIWAQEGVRRAREYAKRARELTPLYRVVRQLRAAGAELPWQVGYRMAQAVRSEVGRGDTDRFDADEWIGARQAKPSSHGIHGLVAVENNRCGLVLGTSGDAHSRLTPRARRFRQARALGRVLSDPDQHAFLLSGARGYQERVARAFAAELLAPAAGIDKMLSAAAGDGDWALDAVADAFDVSPLLVRHQYDNQIASV